MRRLWTLIEETEPQNKSHAIARRICIYVCLIHAIYVCESLYMNVYTLYVHATHYVDSRFCTNSSVNNIDPIELLSYKHVYTSITTKDTNFKCIFSLYLESEETTMVHDLLKGPLRLMGGREAEREIPQSEDLAWMVPREKNSLKDISIPGMRVCFYIFYIRDTHVRASKTAS